MKKLSIALLVITVFLPLSLFFLPLWTIEMDAPQYPEGLGLFISIDKIEGTNEHGLESVNRLNHYIGMKVIEPDSIKEFVYIPKILIGMTVLGLIVILLRKKSFILAWLVLYCALGALGLYDFYLWEVDYGTNLDPKAIIKTAGLSYQPPFIGTAEIMNFKVLSMPASGGFLLFFALTLGFIVVFYEYKFNKNVK